MSSSSSERLSSIRDLRRANCYEKLPGYAKDIIDRVNPEVVQREGVIREQARARVARADYELDKTRRELQRAKAAHQREAAGLIKAVERFQAMRDEDFSDPRSSTLVVKIYTNGRKKRPVKEFRIDKAHLLPRSENGREEVGPYFASMFGLSREEGGELTISDDGPGMLREATENTYRMNLDVIADDARALGNAITLNSAEALWRFVDRRGASLSSPNPPEDLNTLELFDAAVVAGRYGRYDFSRAVARTIQDRLSVPVAADSVVDIGDMVAMFRSCMYVAIAETNPMPGEAQFFTTIRGILPRHLRAHSANIVNTGALRHLHTDDTLFDRKCLAEFVGGAATTANDKFLRQELLFAHHSLQQEEYQSPFKPDQDEEFNACSWKCADSWIGDQEAPSFILDLMFDYATADILKCMSQDTWPELVARRINLLGARQLGKVLERDELHHFDADEFKLLKAVLNHNNNGAAAGEYDFANDPEELLATKSIRHAFIPRQKLESLSDGEREVLKRNKFFEAFYPIVVMVQTCRNKRKQCTKWSARNEGNVQRPDFVPDGTHRESFIKKRRRTSLLEFLPIPDFNTAELAFNSL